jgi:hypothetical protein
VRQYHAFQSSLAAWLEALPKPVGLLAANDSRARQVLDVCRAIGVRVPEEVAVLGIDNDEMVCQLSSPLLSSIEQGARQIGHRWAWWNGSPRMSWRSKTPWWREPWPSSATMPATGSTRRTW